MHCLSGSQAGHRTDIYLLSSQGPAQYCSLSPILSLRPESHSNSMSWTAGSGSSCCGPWPSSCCIPAG